ncbi:MAG: VWA domain-containing protein [Isosphaeraceae bacterium]
MPGRLPEPPDELTHEPRRLRSPLFDVRALGGSTFVHALLLLSASAMMVTVALPRRREEARTIRGEVGPVDNRAVRFRDGGGAPGEGGGQGTPADGDDPARLLESMLSPRATADMPRWLRPRDDRRAGTRATSAPGGEGGSGGGIGGGQGGGVGRGTEFFGTRDEARNIVYVIDRSGSMTNSNSLAIAKRELLDSVDELGEESRFAVVFYDTRPAFADSDAMAPASADHKARLHAKLASIEPDGGTDHKAALFAALRLRPEAVFFLTDADQMTDPESDEIRDRASRSGTRIHAVEFGAGPAVVSSRPLRRLAVETRGTYRYIDVTTFR